MVRCVYISNSLCVTVQCATGAQLCREKVKCGGGTFINSRTLLSQTKVQKVPASLSQSWSQLEGRLRGPRVMTWVLLPTVLGMLNIRAAGACRWEPSCSDTFAFSLDGFSHSRLSEWHQRYLQERNKVDHLVIWPLWGFPLIASIAEDGCHWCRSSVWCMHWQRTPGKTSSWLFDRKGRGGQHPCAAQQTGKTNKEGRWDWWRIL